jgi:hypothetical protein
MATTTPQGCLTREEAYLDHLCRLATDVEAWVLEEALPALQGARKVAKGLESVAKTKRQRERTQAVLHVIIGALEEIEPVGETFSDFVLAFDPNATPEERGDDDC